RHTILVVEDEVLTRFSIAQELRIAGFAVIEAANAHEAMAVLHSGTAVDAVMTDVHMPGTMDGVALAEAVRGAWPDIKIIVTSGHLSAQAAPGVIDAFFAKPYDPMRVMTRLKQLLAVGQS